MMGLSITSQKLTADGVIGVSGKPIRVFALLVKSDSSGSSVILYNGTGTGGTEMDTVKGTASDVTRVNYAGGMLLPSGGYIDLDGTHTTYVVALYSQEAN